MCRHSKIIHDTEEKVLITYYPNRRNLFVLPVFALCFIGGLGLCGEIILRAETIAGIDIISMVFLLGISVCCVICCKIFYDTAQQVIYCTVDGLYIVDNRYIGFDFISWNNMSYVYETRDNKGHVYWVFSKKLLTKKETNRLATKSAWLLSLHVDQTIVIWNNASHTAKEFSVELKKHIEIINYT